MKLSYRILKFWSKNLYICFATSNTHIVAWFQRAIVCWNMRGNCFDCHVCSQQGPTDIVTAAWIVHARIFDENILDVIGSKLLWILSTSPFLRLLLFPLKSERRMNIRELHSSDLHLCRSWCSERAVEMAGSDVHSVVRELEHAYTLHTTASRTI